MEYTTLGATGLRVSVAGFGCGGNSRLGQGTGLSEAGSVALVRAAIDVGVNFFDTAASYGTERIVGEAIRAVPRDAVVISTKCHARKGTEAAPVADVLASLENSLRELRTEYVDVFNLHGVAPQHYDHALAELAPALLRAKEAGKLRHLGITETAARDAGHEMLNRAVDDGCWEVMMLAFHMMNQNARARLFPATLKNGIGTLLMFVVRNIFSQPRLLAETVAALLAAGKLAPGLDAQAPLGFLLHDGGADSVTDAAYRFARHEPGADVVLFGTGSIDHMHRNVASILKPPLPAADVAQLYDLFGALEGVGLDLPDRMRGEGAH